MDVSRIFLLFEVWEVRESKWSEVVNHGLVGDHNKVNWVMKKKKQGNKQVKLSDKELDLLLRIYFAQLRLLDKINERTTPKAKSSD